MRPAHERNAVAKYVKIPEWFVQRNWTTNWPGSYYGSVTKPMMQDCAGDTEHFESDTPCAKAPVGINAINEKRFIHWSNGVDGFNWDQHSGSDHEINGYRSILESGRLVPKVPDSKKTAFRL